MSQQRPVDVACAHCGEQQRVTFYFSINADRVQGIAEAILDGSFQVFSCIGCGQRFSLELPWVYTHFGAGRWAVVYPPTRRAEFHALEAEAHAVFEREVLLAPPHFVRERARGVRPIIAFGSHQLAEKLRADRAGIDDRALELLKLVIYREHLSRLLETGWLEFTLEAVDADHLHFRALHPATSAPLGQLLVDRGEIDRVEAERAAFAAAFPELFDRCFVNVLRYFDHWTID